MIFNNYQEILNYIFRQQTSVEEVLECLKSNIFSRKLGAVRFLLEICIVTRMQESDLKKEFFKKLIENNLFDFFADYLSQTEDITEKIFPKAEQLSIDESIFQSATCLENFTLAHGTNKLELLQAWSSEIIISFLQTLPCN